MKFRTFNSAILLAAMSLSLFLVKGNTAYAAETTGNSGNQLTDLSKQLTAVKNEKQQIQTKLITIETQQKETLEKIQATVATIKKIQTIEEVLTPGEDILNKDSSVVSLAEKQTVEPSKSAQTKASEEDQKNDLNALQKQAASLDQDSAKQKEQKQALSSKESALSQQINQLNEQQTAANKASNLRSEIVASAETHLGQPYVYGAAGPTTFDCSGLVQFVFRSVGISLGRTTTDQDHEGTVIPVSEAQAGDLVFWGAQGSSHHVGISLGNGSYIHAPIPGDVVQITSVSSYSPDFALRVL